MMPARRELSRHRISLAALLAAWAVLVLWLGWTKTVIDLLDSMARARAEAAARAE